MQHYFFVVGTEIGLYGLLTVLFVPLYTRIKREKALDHFIRGQVYEYIKLNPGQHYNAIREHLNLKNGTLAYHLKTLEYQQFIKSTRDKLFKRFYPVEMKIPQEKGYRLSDIQMKIADLIKQKPGITQGDIIRKLDMNQQVASYNLRVLEKYRVIKKQKSGRTSRYYYIWDEID